jgi:hypothetical protein
MVHIVSILKNRHPACLIPNHKKVERRLLSILMGAMEIVPELRGKILQEAGYGSGKTAQYLSFMEPEFSGINLPSGRPDGIVVCERGKSTWSAFFEAKSESNLIKGEQIVEYAELAAHLGVDAIITLSNEHALTPDDLPYHVKASRLKKRRVVHLSWSTIAVKIELLLSQERTLPVAELKVLQEVLRYMTTSGSGVQTFDQMPPSWSDFVTQSNAPHGLNKNTQGVRETVTAWQQERRDLYLKLLSKVGGAVDLWFDRKSKNDPAIRDANDIDRLVTDYELHACYVFTSTKVDMFVTANLRSCLTRVVAVIKPPAGKQAKGVVSWLLNSLSNCPNGNLDIHFDWPREKNDIFTTLDELRKTPEIGSQTLNSAPPEIRLSLSTQAVRSFKSRKKFVEELESTSLGLTDLLADAKFI